MAVAVEIAQIHRLSPDGHHRTIERGALPGDARRGGAARACAAAVARRGPARGERTPIA